MKYELLSFGRLYDRARMVEPGQGRILNLVSFTIKTHPVLKGYNMAEKPSYEELERQIEQLKKTESELRRKEDVLRESEKKYQKLSGLLHLMCDNVPDMIWAKDLEKKYIFANRAICKNLLNATDTEETLGKTDIFFAERERRRFPDNPEWHTFGEICRDTDQITMDAGMPRQFDEYGNVQGKFLFLDVHKAPFIDETGKMIGTVGSGRDITDRKRIEESLVDHKRRLEYILQGTNIGTWEWNVQTGEATFNQRWAEIIGYTFEEITPITIDTWIKFCHPYDLKESERLLKDCFEGRSEYYHCECRMKHKDGTWIWVLDRGKIATWTDDGKPEWMYGTHQDITDRKRAEDQLKRNEKLYRTLFSDSITPIFMVDEKSRSYIDANQAALDFMECTKELLVGRSVYENSPPEKLEQTKKEHGNFSEVKSLETEYL